MDGSYEFITALLKIMNVWKIHAPCIIVMIICQKLYRLLKTTLILLYNILLQDNDLGNINKNYNKINIIKVK